MTTQHVEPVAVTAWVIRPHKPYRKYEVQVARGDIDLVTRTFSDIDTAIAWIEKWAGDRKVTAEVRLIG